MAKKLIILEEPNPKLRLRSREAQTGGEAHTRLQSLIADLIETMYAADGIGIAAPQVGENVRLIVIGRAALTMTENAHDFDHKKDLVLLNPVLTKTSAKKIWGEEGCLSVPEVFGEVKRYHKIRCRAHLAGGATVDFSASDFLARVIQHEIDHLDGVLFIDKAKNLKKTEGHSSTGL